MRLMIVGANGFIGRAVARAATARGTEVFAVSRSPPSGRPDGFTHLTGDRRRAARIRELSVDLGLDAIVDVIAMTLVDTLPLLRALEGVDARYVLVSSSDVYRNYGLLHRQERGMPVTTQIAEDGALRKSRYPYRTNPPRASDDPRRWLEDYDKIPIERAVRAQAPRWTILRLPMVYGPGDAQHRFRWAIEHMATSDLPLVIPRAFAFWVSTYGYVDDVADAIALASMHPSAQNRVYNVGEPDCVHHLDWARRFATALGWAGRIEIGADANDRLEPLDLSVPLRLSSRRIRDELGYQESVEPEDRLARTVADERIRPG